MNTLNELYSALTGNIKPSCVDAVSVAAALGGVHRTTARQWYASLNAKEWSAAFTPGKSHIKSKLAVGNSGTELAVGNPETDLTALPDTLPVVADVAETSSESDWGLVPCVPQPTRTRPEIWKQLDFRLRAANGGAGHDVVRAGMAERRLWAVHKLVEAACPRFDRNLEPFDKIC